MKLNSLIASNLTNGLLLNYDTEIYAALELVPLISANFSLTKNLQDNYYIAQFGASFGKDVNPARAIAIAALRANKVKI